MGASYCLEVSEADRERKYKKNGKYLNGRWSTEWGGACACFIYSVLFTPEALN